MEDDGVVVLYDGSIVTTDPTKKSPNPFSIKVGLTHILRGEAIVEVSDPRQAKIAENTGACCISVTGNQRGGDCYSGGAALMMQLGCDGVFVGAEVFDGVDPFKKVRAMVEAVRNYNDPVVLADVCSGLSDAMARMNMNDDESC